MYGRAPPSQCSFSVDGSGSPWLIPSQYSEVLRAHSWLTTTDPSSTTGWLAVPTANRGAMPRLHSPRMQKALVVHLFGQ